METNQPQAADTTNTNTAKNATKSQALKEWASGAIYQATQKYAIELLFAGLVLIGTFFWHAMPEPLRSQITTGSIAKPGETAAEIERKRIEADCLARREKEVAVVTQQRIATWAEYQTCLKEPRIFVSAEAACKPKLDRHLEFSRKFTELQGRTCTAAK